MKFAHLGDCHLGGWRQPELKELNFLCFKEALSRCLNEKVDFILIAGDLFDSPYPPIDTLKETFEEFKKIKEANIPVYLIAGSHDYSVSGKTFLDVLEKAGFCKNVSVFEEKDEKIILQPTVHENVAIYGYPGKKSGIEVREVERIKLQEAPGLFKILMLHTTLRDAIGSLPIDSVDERNLPKVDYTALAHLHIDYNKDGRVYCGPIFPNNISELEELGCGSFYIFENGKARKEELRFKEIVTAHLEITNALTATENLLSLLKTKEVKDKIVIIRLSGIIEKGRISDIDFQSIDAYLKKNKALVLLKSTSKLAVSEKDTETELEDSENLEQKVIEKFEEKNPGKLNSLIPHLIHSLQTSKLEDETQTTFEERFLSEARKILQI